MSAHVPARSHGADNGSVGARSLKFNESSCHSLQAWREVGLCSHDGKDKAGHRSSNHTALATFPA